MKSASHVHSIDFLIGRTILSRTTANNLGRVGDLIIDVAKGELAGLLLHLPDGSFRSVEYSQIHSFGPDAVMISSDEAVMPAEDSTLKHLPLAKFHLIGVNVVTESGKLLGQVANVYIRLAETVLLIYEVRSSLLEKLLGHALYFPASQGQAISTDFARIVVADDTAAKADNSLDALIARLFGPPKDDPIVIVRSRGY